MGGVAAVGHASKLWPLVYTGDPNIYGRPIEALRAAKKMKMDGTVIRFDLCVDRKMIKMMISCARWTDRSTSAGVIIY